MRLLSTFGRNYGDVFLGLPPNLWVKALSRRLGRVEGGPHDPALVGAWQLSAPHPGLGKGSIALVLPPAG